MCGIVGLFLKDPALEPELGSMLGDMLVTMTDRGPDSAGMAIYGGAGAHSKVMLQSRAPEADFAALATQLAADLPSAELTQKDTHALILLPPGDEARLAALLSEGFPQLTVMSRGASIEIFKEVGLPRDVLARFAIPKMGGTHGVGHTRMATESAVTTQGAHPFSTGADQCLVHNGSLSNHHNLKRRLRHKGVPVETENDSEVAAAYLTWRMQEGANLGEALEAGLRDLDGFYTFVVGTRDGFGVLRDPIACKPAVLAETDRYVAFCSEYRGLVDLPGIEAAKVWEPEPATVYFWER